MQMKKIPWKGIGISCALLVLLVIGRCAVTVGRVIYYGGSNWLNKILSDPWTMVGIAAAAVCAIAFGVLAFQTIREKRNDGHDYIPVDE